MPVKQSAGGGGNSSMGVFLQMNIIVAATFVLFEGMGYNMGVIMKCVADSII